MSIDITPPCLVPGVFNDDYHSSPGISSSQIKPLDRSAAHYDAEYGPLAKPRKRTPQMEIGTMVHCLMEGNVDIEQLVAIPPDFNLRKPADREKKKEWLDANKDKIIIGQQELDRAMDIGDALQEDEDVMRLLEGAELELSGWWIDPQTGLLCKFRPDVLRRDIRMIIDWKTCDDASTEAFMWSAKRYRYYISAAHYLNGMSAVTFGEIYQFAWVAVESTKPYGIKIYWAEQPGIQECKSRVQAALRRYKEAAEAQYWAKYEHKIEPLPYRRW